MTNDNKISPPKFDQSQNEDDIINVMIRWMHDRGCAVCVWTEKELKGVRPQDIESGMIEWGGEAIQMNAVEEEEEEEEDELDEADNNNNLWRKTDGE